MQPVHIQGFAHQHGVLGQTTAFGDFVVGHGGDGHQHHVSEHRVAAQGFEQGKTVHTRHVQVGQQHLGAQAVDVNQRLHGGGHDGAVQRQLPLVDGGSDQFEADLVVIHHQDLQQALAGHAKLGLQSVAGLVVAHRLQRNAAVTPFGLPRLQLAALHQGLHCAHGQAQQLGREEGATKIGLRFERGFGRHKTILLKSHL